MDTKKKTNIDQFFVRSNETIFFYFTTVVMKTMTREMEIAGDGCRATARGR